jgi:hypothetical protein
VMHMVHFCNFSIAQLSDTREHMYACLWTRFPFSHEEIEMDWIGAVQLASPSRP